MKKLPFLFSARLLTGAETESGMEGAAGTGLQGIGHGDGSQKRAAIDGSNRFAKCKLHIFTGRCSN